MQLALLPRRGVSRTYDSFSMPCERIYSASNNRVRADLRRQVYTSDKFYDGPRFAVSLLAHADDRRSREEGGAVPYRNANNESPIAGMKRHYCQEASIKSRRDKQQFRRP